MLQAHESSSTERTSSMVSRPPIRLQRPPFAVSAEPRRRSPHDAAAVRCALLDDSFGIDWLLSAEAAPAEFFGPLCDAPAPPPPEARA